MFFNYSRGPFKFLRDCCYCSAADVSLLSLKRLLCCMLKSFRFVTEFIVLTFLTLPVSFC